MRLCFQNPDPRKMQIMLTGFLNGKNARIFMGELWDLLLSAQASPSGIPKQFLDQKKEELKKKMVIIAWSQCLYKAWCSCLVYLFYKDA